MSEKILDIKDERLSFFTPAGEVKALNGVSFTMNQGDVLGVVGESGSGKSVTAYSIMGLTAYPGKLVGGKVWFNGHEIENMKEKDFRKIRGNEVSIIFQDPMTSLNPVYTIGWQIEEGLRAHGMKDKKELRAKAINILKKVGIPDAETRVDYYPHQFSGGQKQRIVIAMALVLNPGLILADEPTTALDVTVQAEILDLLRLARDEFDASVLIITHNMGVIADIADQVVVMYRGHVVEQGDVEQIFYHPKDDYTKRLLGAVPRIGQKLVVRDREGKPIERKADWREQPIAVEAKNLTITYPGHLMQPDFKAVDGANFTIHRSEVLGLVGESGSGKSTVANMVLKLLEPTAGTVTYDGKDISGFKGKELLDFRRHVQPVFQNPYGSLDPMYSIYRSIEEPLRIHGIGDKKSRAKRVRELIDMVELPESVMSRYPNELSGGQRQRIAIARAMALDPDVIVCDEAVSALDVLVQDQVLRLLNDLQAEKGLSYLFITHDLAVVRQIADEVVVMQHGKLVEHATTDEVFDHPKKQYTRDLLDAIPGGKLQLGLD